MDSFRKIRGLDLFSGVGGIGLAISEWVQTIAYCEQDKYAQGVLLSRMQSGDIDRAPIFDDVRSLSEENFITKPEIIFGGFPCQDLSTAGTGRGLDGERSGLFFEVVRLTKEIRPAFVFLENVPAIRTRGLNQVVKSFAEMGYVCRWTCLSAESVGANHKRERWFFLAYANGSELRHEQGRRCGQNWQEPAVIGNNGSQKSLANAESIRHETRETRNCECESDQTKAARQDAKRHGAEIIKPYFRANWWAVEPDVGRVVNGLPYRVDRLRGLGNAVVPQAARQAFMRLMGLDRKSTRLNSSH